MIDGQPKHSMSMVLQMKDPDERFVSHLTRTGFKRNPITNSTLSDKQIQEAIMLAKDDLVKQLNSTSWSVVSISQDDSYLVQRADDVHAYDLYCKCKGWQFKRGEKDCKHCEAVRQFVNKTNKTTKPKTTKKHSLSHPQTKTETKNQKIMCWHCNDPDQKINEEELWFCTKCGEGLWTGLAGQGGYVLVEGKWK